MSDMERIEVLLTDPYVTKAIEIGVLVSRKNRQYGNAIVSMGVILREIYPNGISPDQYEDLGVMVRVIDKLKRVGRGNQGGENAWEDVAGYGLLKSMPNLQTLDRSSTVNSVDSKLSLSRADLDLPIISETQEEDL